MRTTNNIGYLLNHLAFVMGRQSDQILQERLGIGFSQFKILMVLKKNPHIQQKDIAQRLGQTEASISRQIKLLHDDGLLQTVKRPENKREHITTLTLKGERFTDEALEILAGFGDPIFEPLSDKQKANLIDHLQVIHDGLCGDGGAASCHKMFNPTN